MLISVVKLIVVKKCAFFKSLGMREEQEKKCLPELRTLILEESSCNVLA